MKPNISRTLERLSAAAIMLILSSALSFAQTGTVSGKVVDQNGEPLAGIAVFIDGTTTGEITSLEGTYTIKAGSKDILVFSALGYAEQRIPVGNLKTINATMKAEAFGLDETVVIGYGTQSKRLITSAVAKVSGDVLENNPVTTLGDALKGRVAGARVYTDNFTPGSDAVITIRGGSSINGSNNPLILVDGIERTMAGLNPADIESIEILKDAASTAIYGSRGSNGIVLITTKKGSASEKPVISFEATVGVQGPETLYDLMNAEDYLSYVRPAANTKKYAPNLTMNGKSCSSFNNETSIYSTRYLNDGETIPEGYKSMADPLDPTKTLIFQDNDWQRILYRTTVFQNYHVNLSGGTQKTKYLASIGYTDDEGVALGTSYERLSSKLSITSEITEKLSFRGNIDFATTTDEYITHYRDNIARSLYAAPTMKMYFEDGTPTWGINDTATTPLYYNFIHNTHSQRNHMSMFGGLTYRITPFLKADVQASYYYQDRQYGDFENANHFSSSRATSENLDTIRNKKIEAYLDYSKTFHKHSIGLMGGYSYFMAKNYGFAATAEGGAMDKVRTLTAAPLKTSATSYFEDQCLIGWFGRFNYDFAKKYLFSATFRADGSSLFAAGHKWGYFPAASAGWIMSDEDFMANAKHISFFKWKASFGQTGNNVVGLYDALGAYASTKYDSNAGMVPSDMPNGNLTWETTTQLDAGAEIGFFDNRIMINGDYFRKVTDNLLFPVTLPNTSGFSSIMSNVGSVLFQGFDLEISTKNIDHKNFKWDSKFTWSFVKNRVISLPDNGRDRNRIGGTVVGDGSEFGGIAEGEPMFGIWGYKVDHIIQTPEEAANARYDTGSKGYNFDTGKATTGSKYAGDYEWMNREGSSLIKVNGVEKEQINSEDMFLLGYTVPHSTGGFGNNFTFGNFTANIYLDWALGHTIVNLNEGYTFTNHMTCDTALNEKVKYCWTGEGDTNAKYAKFRTTDPQQSGNFNRVSDVFTYKGDYLCIREVSLGYQLPKNIVRKMNMQAASVVISGNNLYYFTAVPGVSPELGTGNNFDNNYGGTYPPCWKVSLGVKVTF